MEAASQHSNGFEQPLLTQPQAWDEDSAGGTNNGDAGDFSGVGNDEKETNGKIPDIADGSSMFEVEEDHVNDGQDDDFGDGFNLLTQSNEMFKVKESAMDGGDSSSGGSSEDSSESSSSEEDDGSGSDAPTEIECDVTTLQERRERNVRRNNAFLMELKLGLNTIMDGGQTGNVQGKQLLKRKDKVIDEQEDCNTSEKDRGDLEEITKGKRRGMIFSTTRVNKQQKFPLNVTGSAGKDPPLTTKSLADELKLNYPHRSNQIHSLCSQLVTIVQKSKFAWQMTDNLRSSGNTQYSEASYQGDTKLAAPSPIIITGTAGNGKTCIVRDAMKALRRRTNGGIEAPTVADAYVDCASSESGSVAAVMNSAYRQLYECYHLRNGFGRYGKVRVEEDDTKDGEKGKHVSGIARSSLRGNDFEEDFQSDVDDEDDLGEDLLERSRLKRKKKEGLTCGKNSKKEVKAVADKAKTHEHKHVKNVRQTRLRATLATKASSEPALKSPGIKGSFHGAANRNTQSSSSVALFGRATSALIQGNATKNKSSQNWRCAFLILDNADRILSWKKQHGSVCPLTQIFLLPSVMGINLTLIFISRSTIFQYSPVHNPPGTVLDAVHPQTIHFNSYTDVEMIKSILHVPHVQKSIMGRSPSTSHMFSCNHASKLRSELNDLLYTSMMNSIVPSVKSSTHDITEIMRLARLLWPEYVAPLDKSKDCGDPSLKALMWQVLGCLQRDTNSSNELCHDSNCSFCRYMSVKTGDDAAVMDLNVLKQRLSEKLDKNIRDGMRSLLSTTVMMPGRALSKQNSNEYAGSLPYITKFLLLAAFLCQKKRAEQDVNLFTTKNTGKSKRKRSNKSDEGSAFASSSKDLTRRQPSFNLERMLSVFYSIIGQYGQHYMNYKEEAVSTVAQLGTERLFQNISQLIATGLLSSIGSVKINEKIDHDLMEITSAKFSCMISRDDACVIASSVGFPLEKYSL